MSIKHNADQTPVVSDELLHQYAEAYLVRKPVPYTFIEYVRKLEVIRKSNYAYEYADYATSQDILNYGPSNPRID